MSNVTYPYRVTILAPRLGIPQGAEYLAPTAALLLFTTLFEHLMRHPRLAIVDPDDFQVTDGDDRLITVDHPDIDRVRNDQLGNARRDELIWFDLSIDPARPGPVKLGAERFDGKREEFAAIGQAPLSQLMANCLHQWLSARGLPLPARPLEAFDANDVGYGAKCAYDTIASRQEDGSLNVQMPQRLLVPFLRLVNVSCSLYTYEQILQIEPDNPWAIRDMFIDGLHRNGPESRDPIRRALQTAPMYGKLYLSMFGKDVPADESLHSFAMGTYLNPQNPFAPKDYAFHLDEAGRWEEAWRWAERAVRAVPLFLDAHIVSMAVNDSCRFGERLIDCGHHMGFIDSVTERGIVAPDDPGARNIRLQYANMLKRAGRLQEAIALRGQVLQGLEEKWPQQTKILREWQSDPTELAEAYAREAHHRGDPGRVLEAFGAYKPEGAADLAMLVDALVALGKEDLALLAYAQHVGRGPTSNPVARLAGAKAQILCGRTGDAIESLLYVSLRFPQLRWETAVNRLLRLAAARPAAEWEAVVKKKLAMGAKRVATLIARDAADFVPGMEKSPIIAQGLAGSSPVAFDASWLAPLRKALGLDLSQQDAFFAHYAQPSLAHADAMAVDWAALVPSPHDNDTDETTQARAGRILFLFAGSVMRYLAATTQPPSVLAGGYRQVAGDALEMLRSVRGVLPRVVVRSFFEVLERIAPAVDEWILDTWLLRFERALDLEANEAGKLEPLSHGFPTISALLRGDERVGMEYRTAWLALKAEDVATALPLYERTVRAIGNHAAPGWSDTAVKRLPPDQALDVHLTAAHTNTNNARPSVEAARVLLGAGRGPEALEALLLGFGAASGQKWQKTKLGELAPMWAQANVPVPFDFNQCQTVGMNALNQGQFDLAALAYRMCLAQDAKNEVAHKNLGIACARQGKVYEAVNAFCGANPKQGALMAAIAFKDAQKWTEATYAYRLASLWFDSAEKWQYFATAAYMAEDSDAAAEAYGRVAQMNPGLLDPAGLNAYATAACEIGDYQTAATIAKQMVDRAGNDPTWASCGMNNMACALLGMKRGQEALQWAEQAMKINPRPDNRQAFAETVERAKRNDAAPLKARRAGTPEGQAWKLLEDGDFKQVAAMLGGAASWKIKRAAVTASIFRFESENDARVTPRALEAARVLATTTYGATDLDALVARADALRIRENAFFPVDVPCPLGTRLPRPEFQRAFEQQTGKPGPQAMAAAQMAQQLVASGAAGDPDPTVFPGGPVPRLSDYVRIMKGMQSGNPMGALKAAGLNMQQYGQVATAWGQKMAADPTLTAKFTKMMTG